MTPQIPDQSVDNTRQHVENALACLRMIGVANLPPEHLAGWALQEIYMAAAGGADLAAIAPEASREARDLLFKTCADVDASVNGKILPERIYFFMGMSSGLFAPGDDPFRADRLDYTGILAAELRALHHRRNLNSRGFPLLRDARARHAWAAPFNESANVQ